MRYQASSAKNVLLLAFGLASGLLQACGDDGDPPAENVGNSGSGGSEMGGSAGEGGSESGGMGGMATNGGSGGMSAGGTTGDGGSTAGVTDAGTGGSATEADAGTGDSSAAGDPDDVVAAVCDFEFRCCDEGELDYRLSPFATDADTCASRFVFEMRQSNATANPYFSGPAAAGGLLGTLGYVVDLTRVDVRAEGVAECVASIEARGCAVEADPAARCDGPASTDPCALSNLFEPILNIGDECTAALTEGGLSNDIECVAGSTCLPASNPDNPNDFPTCVKRNQENEPCTADDDCDFNFYCGSGSCSEKSEAGEACSFNDPAEPLPNDERIKCKSGLSCHPNELVCVESCTIDAACVIDSSCPAGAGCAPLEVAESTASFKTCQALGTTAANLCDSDADCVPTRYCDGTACQADKTAGADCVDQNECATGLHCDVATTATCVTNLAALNPCELDEECGPESSGCLDGGSDGSVCRNNLLANGDACGVNAACASGLCEFASEVAVETTCVPGEAAAALCDTIVGDGTAQSCAAGLLCFGETGATESGTCVVQARAGQNCNDPDGDANALMCASGSACDDVWQEGEICTDAAILVANSGTGLTCDGT